MLTCCCFDSVLQYGMSEQCNLQSLALQRSLGAAMKGYVSFHAAEDCPLYNSGKYGLSNLTDSYIARAGARYCKETFQMR